MHDDELERLAQEAEQEISDQFVRRERKLEDFRYDESQEKYWDITTASLMAARSVDGAIPQREWPTRIDRRNGQPRQVKPSVAINDVETGLTVETSTWWPGEKRFIEDVVVNSRGVVNIDGAVTYNTYIAPDYSRLRTNQNPDAWIEHVKFLWPDPVEHEHFFNFAAHMIQRPDEKVNHGIVLAGEYGIGKDAALQPLRYGVGEWNACEIEPDAISSPWTDYLRSVLLIINEVRPHDEDFKASNFYNQIKPMLASPPDMLPVQSKYVNPVYIRNLVHVLLTTNDPLTMFIPEADRRLFVMTSQLPDPKKVPVFSPQYFDEFFNYLQDGGNDAVVRWLLNRDISDWKPQTPPPMTQGKDQIIKSANEVRRGALDDFLDQYFERVYGTTVPQVVFTADLYGFLKAADWFDDVSAIRKSLAGKSLHFKMSERGYKMVQNPESRDFSIRRSGQRFKSRMAFCHQDVPRDHRLKVVQAELEKRPLDFNNADLS